MNDDINSAKLTNTDNPLSIDSISNFFHDLNQMVNHVIHQHLHKENIYVKPTNLFLTIIQAKIEEENQQNLMSYIKNNPIFIEKMKNEHSMNAQWLDYVIKHEKISKQSNFFNSQ